MSMWRRITSVLVGLAAIVCLLFGTPGPGHAQTPGILKVTVSVASGEGGTIQGRRHVLLVSDNPASRAPWRIVTAADGTGKATLPPGNYTVESEAPLIAQGRTFEWRQTIDVTAGGETTLALNAGNAEIGAASAASTTPGTPPKTDQWDLLVRWQDSVVALWTPLTHASGVVIDPTGLIATTQRVVGDATSVEVQLTPTLKVAARVIAADATRDVAILWIAPTALGARAPLPLDCEGRAPRPLVERGHAVSAIGTPVRRQPTTTRGVVRRAESGAMSVAFDVPPDSAGGPVFAFDGALVGFTSVAREARPDDGLDQAEVPVAGLDAVCAMVAMARARVAGAAPPATPLPVEPEQGVPEDTLRQAVTQHTGSLTPARVMSSSFDVDLISPVAAYAAAPPAVDFGQWAGYVADRPAVLLLRASPRQVESLWLKVARGAAMTQGIALPPITHYEPGFARMRVLCGEKEITPIHPFVVERRVSETAAIKEGLSVFALDAIGPHCGTVTLELFSEKTPDKRESVKIDARILERIWQELAPYRAQATPH